MRELPPLHAKPTGRADISKLRRDVLPRLPSHLRARLEKALRFLDDPAVYEEALTKEPLKSDEAVPPSRYRREDVAQQFESGFVRPQSDPAVMCIPFTVWEDKMKEVRPEDRRWGDIDEVTATTKRILRRTTRRRPILWPKAMNERKWNMNYIDLPGLEEQLGALVPGFGYRAYDLTASFFQLPLSPEVSRYFSFQDEDGKIYSYTVLPMGFFGACEVLQALLSALAFLSTEDLDVRSTIYIDNIRFGGAVDTDVNLAGSRFTTLCSQLGIMLNEESSNQLHTEQDFCGVHYRVDHSSAHVKLPIGQLTKIREDTDRIIRPPRTSVRSILEVASRLYWGSRVLHLDLAFAYYAIKFNRKISQDLAAGRLSMDDEVEIWPSVKPIFCVWRRLLLRNQEATVVLEAASPDFLLATDASKWGFGAVLIDRRTGKVASCGGAWSPLESARSINELEIMALARGAEAFHDTIRHHSTSVYIDNEAARSSLRRGSSKSYMLNLRVSDALPKLSHINGTLYRVASANNPSDEPSRNKNVDLEKTRQWASTLHLVPHPNCVANFSFGLVAQVDPRPAHGLGAGYPHLSQPSKLPSFPNLSHRAFVSVKAQTHSVPMHLSAAPLTISE